MIDNKDVRLRTVVRRFINVFVIYAYQEKPDISPVTANAENQITTPDLTEKQSKKYNGYHNDHQRHKYDKGIQTIDNPDWRQENFHGTK